MSEKSEILSLITLLDDSDETVYSIAHNKLIEIGMPALEYLALHDVSYDSLLDKKISKVREQLTRNIFKEQFRALISYNKKDLDLEEGVFLIAKQRFPHIDFTRYLELLNVYSKELKSRLLAKSDDMEIIQTINDYFLHHLGFHANRENYYEENNHYINKILDSKTGVPLSLSVVYLLVGKKINLPLHGIALQGHFILGLSSGNSFIYVDPFNDGKILSVADCRELVQQQGHNFLVEQLEPAINLQIIERMLRNLILSHEQKSESFKAETILQYIDILRSNV